MTAVLRGFAEIAYRDDERQYFITATPTEAADATDDGVPDALRGALEKAVRDTVGRRTTRSASADGNDGHVPGSNPWMAESAVDRERLPDRGQAPASGRQPPLTTSVAAHLLLGSGLALPTDATHAPSWATAGLLAVGLLYFGRVHAAAQRINRLLLAYPLAAASAVFSQFPLVTSVAVSALALLWALCRLRQRTAAAITRAVTHRSAPPTPEGASQPVTVAPPPAPTPAPHGNPPGRLAALLRDVPTPTATDATQLAASAAVLEIIHPDRLPEVSAAARHRFVAALARGPAVRALYRNAALALATVVFGVRLAACALAGAGDGFPFASALLLAATWGFIRLGGTAHNLSVRSVLWPLRGGVWVALALHAPEVPPATPLAWALAPASRLAALAFLTWVFVRSRALERSMPLDTPLNLLALRVFNSGALDDMLRLTQVWRWIGTRQHLDGPDTAGQKLSSLLHYLTGRPERAIVADERSLDQELAAFMATPAHDLGFPGNSIQCNDATWKAAPDRLVEPCDVVLMDLAGFTPDNQGCAYEINLLVQRVPTQRVLLLVNDSTDMAFLERVVQAAWPRRGDERLKALYAGGPLERRPSESEYDWRERLEGRLDGDRLVGLLIDAALPQRSRPVAPPRRWARPLPPAWRLPVKGLFGLLGVLAWRA